MKNTHQYQARIHQAESPGSTDAGRTVDNRRTNVLVERTGLPDVRQKSQKRSGTLGYTEVRPRGVVKVQYIPAFVRLEIR